MRYTASQIVEHQRRGTYTSWGTFGLTCLGLLQNAAADEYPRLRGDVLIVRPGVGSTNTSPLIRSTAGTDNALAQQFASVWLRIASSQRELDGMAKALLYRNLRRLYRR